MTGTTESYHPNKKIDEDPSSTQDDIIALKKNYEKSMQCAEVRASLAETRSPAPRRDAPTTTMRRRASRDRVGGARAARVRRVRRLVDVDAVRRGVGVAKGVPGDGARARRALDRRRRARAAPAHGDARRGEHDRSFKIR